MSELVSMLRVLNLLIPHSSFLEASWLDLAFKGENSFMLRFLKLSFSPVLLNLKGGERRIFWKGVGGDL